MTRLAIVVAVGENLPPLSSLSACTRDGEAMSAALKATGRFDDLLILAKPNETTSKTVKSRISAFIDAHRSSDIDEVLFYYSGHGDFSGSDFFYLLSDYFSASKNTTSLANTELDGMIRALSPALFIKVVDACHSGTNYIKSDDDLGEYLKGSGSRFNNVYFLYSSQVTEPSWTDGTLSAFTRSILQPIADQEAGPIRYRDLMSASSDYFEATGGQTPQFVTQATFTEIFCEASPAMQNALAPFLTPRAAPKPPPTGSKPTGAGKQGAPLIERIRQTEASYCSRAEAMAALQVLFDTLAKPSLEGDLADIFNWQTTSSSEEPVAVSVGEWISKNEDRNFFASAEYKRVPYQKRVPKSTSLSSWLTVANLLKNFSVDDTEYKYVTAYREEVSGYKNTADIEIDSISIKLGTDLKPVTPLECVVAPIVSASDVRLFWNIRQFKYSDWDTVVPVEATQHWNSAEALLKDQEAVTALAELVKKDMLSAARKMLAARWPEPAQGVAAQKKQSS